MSISRLQLAAALLEYDNDDDDPSSSRPTISHRDSALFAPYNPKPLDGWGGSHSQRDLGARRGLQPSPVPLARRDGEMMDGPYPSMGKRRSSQYDYPPPSSGMVHPGRILRPQGHYESQSHPPEEVLAPDHLDSSARPTVDVSTWELPDHLLSPDVESGIQSPLEQHFNPSDTSPSSFPRPTLPLQTAELQTPEPITSPFQSRATSIHLDLEDHHLVRYMTRSSMDVETLGGPDDAIDAVLRESERIRMLAEGAIQSPAMIPLPPSPATTLNTFSKPKSSLSTRHASAPSLSALSNDVMVEDEPPNPFALPPLPAELGSRFDPKFTQGSGTAGSRASGSYGTRVSFADTRQSMERRNSVDRMEDFETDFGPQPRQRRMSTASAQVLNVGDNARPESKIWNDIPSAKEFGRPLMPNRYSTMSNLSSFRTNRSSALRPQTLYVPRPLSGMLPPPSPPKNIPDGYTLGEKPLPPGSRSSILSLGHARPGLPMSLSQRTFRNSLMVDGKRDGPLYNGDSPEGQAEILPEVQVDDEVVAKEEERRPGKLFGTSLMDQLEARKAAQKSKQRVFVGDNRPAMMARSSHQPRSPAALPADDPVQDSEAQRHTLLHVPSNGALNTIPRDRITKSTSVFGVDQLWEKELTKLKAREEAEARAEAEQATQEALEGKKKGKKDKGKGKALQLDAPLTPPSGLTPVASPARSQKDLGYGLPISPIKRIPDGPPRLSYSPAKAPPTIIPHLVQGKQRAASGRKDGWSSDEDEDRPLGAGPATTFRRPAIEAEAGDSDSDEDVPLSKLVTCGPTPAHLPHPLHDADSDSDEDVPLSKLVSSRSVSSGHGAAPDPNKQASPTLNLDTAGFGAGSLGLDIPGVTSPTAAKHSTNADEDDDIPLALRRPTPNPDDAEDDIPLGLRHIPPAQPDFRGPMFSLQGGIPGMSSFPSMQWGTTGYPSYPATTPYGYSPGPAPMQGYPFPGMPSMSSMPHLAQGQYNPYAQYPYGPPVPAHGYAPPAGSWPVQSEPMAQQQAAVKKIDSWRKEVAVAPPGSSGGRGSMERRNGGAVV